MNRAPVIDDSLLRLQPEPVDTFGAAGGEPLLWVRGARRLNDGTMVIGNAGFYEVLLYGTDGTLLRRAGGAGGGPGEFVGPSGLTNVWLLGGDTIGIWEHSRSRLSLFDAHGRYVDYLQLKQSARGFPMALGVLDGHRVVARHLTERDPVRAGEWYRDSVRFVAYTEDGQDWSEMARLPGYERIGYEYRGRLSMGARPFARDPVSAVAGRRYYHGTGDAFAILVYELTQLVMVITRPDGDRTLRPSDIDRHKREWLARAPADAETRRDWQRVIDETPYPDDLPAISRIIVATDDRIWVREYPRPGATEVRWSVFSPEGRWEVDAVTPSALQVWEVGVQDAVGVWKDENDVEQVGVFRFRTESSGP
jgi:hypothetical protein